MVQLSEQLIEENPILKAARANSSPAQEVSAPAEPAKFDSESESASSSAAISKTVVGRNEEGITTDSVIADITAGIEQANKLSIERQASLKAAAEQTTAAEKGTIDEAINNAIIQKQVDTANIEADKNVKAAFEARGGVEEHIRLAKAKKVAADRMMDKQKAVDEIVNDNSLKGFFRNIFIKPGVVEEANVAAATFNKLDGIQDNLNSFATQTEKTMDAVRTLDTVATLHAHGKQLEAAAAIKSSLYGAESEKLNAEAVQEAMNMNAVQGDAQIQKWNLLAQRETMKSTAAARKLLADKANKDERVMETWIDGVIAGEKRGGQKEDLSQEHRDNIEAQITAGGEMQERMMDKFMRGIGMEDPTLYQSFNSISLDADNSLIDGSNMAKTVMQDSWNKLIAASKGSPNAEGILTTKPFKLDSATASDMFNEIAATDYANYEARIEEGDNKNPNQAIPLATLVDTPALRDLKPVVKVLKPLITGDTKDLTPTHVFQLIMGGIKTKGNKEGTYTFVEAMETMKAIYTKSALIRTNEQKRLLYGMPTQTSFNAKFESGKILASEGLEPTERIAISSIENLGVVDLMDITKLTNAGLRYMAIKEGSSAEFKKLSVEATGGVFGFGEGIEDRPSATQELLDKINGPEGLK